MTYTRQILEFYAPWCGHCKNLKPAYEKAARNLEGLAHVAAVDCDDEANKPFCGSMGVQGFPTLKIVRPGKKAGKPAVEDYQGPRTAAGIVDAVVERINNHVQRLTDESLDKFLSGTDGPKALLFTEKGTTSALLKSIAIDFLDVIKVGQIRNKETKAAEKFSVENFPTLILLPGGDEEPVVYHGEMKKDAMVKFLSQAGSPNPDPAPVAEKKTKNTSSKSKSTSTATQETAADSDGTEATATAKAPVIIESAPPIPVINSEEKLLSECLNEKSHACVLVFVPAGENEDASRALQALAELAYKHAQSKRHLFPFFVVPGSNPAAASLLKALGLEGGVELIAVNARRGWWRQYEGANFDHEGIESWIDAIRMSEGVKKTLPEGLIAIAVEDRSSKTTQEASSEATAEATGSASSEDATPEASTDASSATDESTSTEEAEPAVEAGTGGERKHEEL